MSCLPLTSFPPFLSFSLPRLAAGTKYHPVGELNNRHLLLMVLEPEKSKIKIPADLVVGVGSFPGLVSSSSYKGKRSHLTTSLKTSPPVSSHL